MNLPGTRRATRTSEPPPAAALGHVVVLPTSATSAIPEGPWDQWERMHVALASWKTRSLLQQARSQLRQGLGSDTDPRLAPPLMRAEDAVDTALAALEELDHLR